MSAAGFINGGAARLSSNCIDVIETSGLIYEYPGLRALDEVSFSIEADTITALVGPNGAGKTTLMRCLAGMDRPLAGSIAVNGVDVIEEPRRSHESIGYLSDFFGLYDDLTVGQSLTYVASANGVDSPRVESVVNQTATDLGLAERLDQRAGDLSRGLRQRVAIAHAIIHAPRVVILDEPASGLDPEARYELGELFLNLRSRGLTLLISSHILSELEAYSTHMLILREGRLIEHRALDTNLESRSRMEIDIVGEDVRLIETLAGHDRISALERCEHGWRFVFAGGASDRAALLRTLVDLGLEVSSFAPVTEDLQQSYLRSIGRLDDDES